MADPFFVNVYQLDRGYGGPEEGGWWYDYEYPIESVKCKRGRQALRLTAALSRRYVNNGNRYSVIYHRKTPDCVIRVERREPCASSDYEPWS